MNKSIESFFTGDEKRNTIWELIAVEEIPSKWVYWHAAPIWDKPNILMPWNKKQFGWNIFAGWFK